MDAKSTYTAGAVAAIVGVAVGATSVVFASVVAFAGFDPNYAADENPGFRPVRVRGAQQYRRQVLRDGESVLRPLNYLRVRQRYVPDHAAAEEVEVEEEAVEAAERYFERYRACRRLGLSPRNSRSRFTHCVGEGSDYQLRQTQDPYQ